MRLMPFLPPSNAHTDLRNALRDPTFTLVIIILFSYLIPPRSCPILVKERLEMIYAGQLACLRTTTFKSIFPVQIIFGPISLLDVQHHLQYDNLSPPHFFSPPLPSFNGRQRNLLRLLKMHKLHSDHRLLTLSIKCSTVSRAVLSGHLTHTPIYNLN